jgi:hypothetical protein
MLGRIQKPLDCNPVEAGLVERPDVTINFQLLA